MNILFVDDEPHNIQAVQEILSEALDVTIHISTTVSDALERLENTSFALVITDIFIPMGKNLSRFVGPRARNCAGNASPLGERGDGGRRRGRRRFSWGSAGAFGL